MPRTIASDATPEDSSVDGEHNHFAEPAKKCLRAINSRNAHGLPRSPSAGFQFRRKLLKPRDFLVARGVALSQTHEELTEVLGFC